MTDCLESCNKRIRILIGNDKDLRGRAAPRRRSEAWRRRSARSCPAPPSTTTGSALKSSRSAPSKVDVSVTRKSRRACTKSRHFSAKSKRFNTKSRRFSIVDLRGLSNLFRGYQGTVHHAQILTAVVTNCRPELQIVNSRVLDCSRV